VGLDNSVGMATGYRLEGPEIESRWGGEPERARPGVVAAQASIQRVPGHSWGYSGRGVALTTHPRLAPRLKKELSYISTPPLGLHGRL